MPEEISFRFRIETKTDAKIRILFDTSDLHLYKFPNWNL